MSPQHDPLRVPTSRRRPRGFVMVLFALFVAGLMLLLLAPQADVFEAIAAHRAAAS